jgi:hypothetical protein
MCARVESASRPGTPSTSAPAHLRNAFLDLIDDETQGPEACQLVAQLVSCTDVLPDEYCQIVGLAPGSTFAQAAECLRTTLGCADGPR